MQANSGMPSKTRKEEKVKAKTKSHAAKESCHIERLCCPDSRLIEALQEVGVEVYEPGLHNNKSIGSSSSSSSSSSPTALGAGVGTGEVDVALQ